MSVKMNSFTGDLSKMWKLQERPPLHHLTWDWWWWLLMLDDENGNPSGKQLMVLWSTKDNPKVTVSGTIWEPKGRPGFDEQSGIALDGMVCAWWYDGKRMHEPLIKQKCRIIAMDDTHEMWPDKSNLSGNGGGAVVPLMDEDLSMGLKSDLSEFWLNLTSDEQDIPGSVPAKMNFQITPWNEPMSTARHANATYLKNMGYDIIRLHGCKVRGNLDDKEIKGTAYFQKVCVQAPSVPWYWGVLHLDDGSYIDWFVPHLSFTITARDNRPWKKRDLGHLSLSQGGLFHDAKNKRTEKFTNVQIEKCDSGLVEGKHGHHPDAPLPAFKVKMWNENTTISLQSNAVDRAHWTFEQPTRGGLTSHFTYNEYPLETKFLRIKDESGIRTEKNYSWIRGNAEHSWGILH
tara:strand:+ start:3110 stop:4315 length:1206 start_codon:yes stop_codon:yes gene_type:complete